MPTMIPDIDPQTIENEGEREVYIRLKEQLPENWTVRYDLTFCRKRGKKMTPDGQVDFIVVIPGRGLLFLEVKGLKDAVFTSDGGQCYWEQRNGLRMEIPDPFKQVQSNKHDVIAMLQNDLKMGEYFKGRYGHAIVFPFVGETGTLPKSHEPTVVWCFSSMDRLVCASERTLGHFGADFAEQNFTGKIERDVCEWLRDKVNLVPVAAADIAQADRAIEALTLQQYEAVSGVLGNSRVRIEGVAGSGKTLITLWAAQKFADDGKKVLLCCFNKKLAEWLREEMESSSIVVGHFHSIASDFCKKASMSLSMNQQDQTFWEDTVPIQFMDALDALGDEAKFDAILVDEAQDFHANWWTPIEMLLKDNTSSLHLFLDPDQTGIYGKGNCFPCAGMTYTLADNCRNSRCITKASGIVAGREISSKIGVPEGIDPVFLKTEPNVQQRTLLLKKQVNKLFHDGYKVEDIAILSAWKRTHSNCSVYTEINNIPVNDDVISWRRGECLFGSTIKAFKGLDAKCIILADLPEYCSPGFTKTDLYVGATRARYALYVSPMSNSVRDYFIMKG